MKKPITKTRLKSVALIGAAALGFSAFGDNYYEWTAEADADTGKAYWEDSSSWTWEGEDGATIDQWRLGYFGLSTVSFKTAASVDEYVAVCNGEYTFAADTSTEEDVVYGLTSTDKNFGLAVGWWWGGDTATLNIASGAYEFNVVNVGGWSGFAGALNVTGGSLTTPRINIGIGKASTVTLSGGEITVQEIYAPNGTFTLAGGTLNAAQDDEWFVNGSSFVVNGGTLNAGGYTLTIPAPLTGSGTLTVTGGGTVNLTGDLSAFKGTITAGDDTTVVAGSIATIEAGESYTFGVYTWTGTGTATTTEEEVDDGEGGTTTQTTTTYSDTDLWSNVNNWLVDGAVPTSAPAADSTVVIPAGDGTALTLTMTEGDCTGYLTINRNVTLSADNLNVVFSTVSGEATLTLAGTSVNRPLKITKGSGAFAIYCPLVIKNWVYLGTTSCLSVYGALSGDGNFTCYSSNGQAGLLFYCDLSGFTGSYTGGMRGSGFRDGTEFYSACATDGVVDGSSAAWSLGDDESGNDKWTVFDAGNGVTYKFGQLTTVFDGYGRLTFKTYHHSSTPSYASNVTLEVGALANGTSNVSGTFYGGGNKMVKVGDTSTLNLTLANNYGDVEAYAGTVNLLGTVPPASCVFTGTGATITVANTCGTYETTTDDEGTETTTLTEAFVPGLCDDFAAYQIVSEAGDDAVTYTLATVATDADYETEYYSVADAIDDEVTTIVLIHSTTEAVTLPLGYSLVLNGYTVGSVAAATGAGLSYDATTQTYTTIDNSAAIWQGDASGANWWDASNWSTGVVPDEGTAITFNYSAVVFITGYATTTDQKCASMAVAKGITVTFAPPEYNEDIYPQINVYGNITATHDCTIVLYRCGLHNATDSAVTVRPAIKFVNSGSTHDSFLQYGGQFTFNSTVYGEDSSRLVVYCNAQFNSGKLQVSDDAIADFVTYPRFSGSGGTISGGGLNGDGRVVIRSWPARNDSQSAYVKSALTNSEKWTGTCELVGLSIGQTYYGYGIDAANYGNANSTVCFNGVSGYLRYSDNAITEVGKVGTIEIGSNGLTLNNGFGSTSNTHGYIIAANITGSGPIHFGSYDYSSAVGQYFLTGSLDEFTGAIDFGSLTGYRPAVIITETAPTALWEVTDYGQIIVGSGSEVTVSSTWDAPGGFVVWGTANVASTGAITSDNGLCGSGKVSYAAAPSTVPTLCAGLTSTGTGSDVPAWTGTFGIAWNPDSSSTGIVLNNYGNANSKVEIEGVDGAFIALPATAASSSESWAAPTVVPEVVLSANWTVNNGWTDQTTTFSKLSGTGTFTVHTGSGNAIPYTITTLEGFTGTLAGTRGQFTIGTIVSSVEPVAGAKLVNCTTTYAPVLDDTVVTYNGETYEVELTYVAGDGIYVPEEEEGGLDPTDEDSSYTSTADTEDEAIEEAKANIVAPDGVDAEDYAEYFTYSVTGESGAYVVTVDGIADDVTEDVEEAVAAAVAAGGDVTVPAGLYYRFTPYEELGGTAGTVQKGAGGTAVTVDQVGETQGFIKVEIGATAFED